MSISKVLREGDLTAYERWELPLVDQEESAERRQLDKGSKLEEKSDYPRTPASESQTENQASTETTLGPLTVEQLEALQKQAYEQAYEEGFTGGLEEGRKAAQTELKQRVAQLEALMATLSRPLQDLDEAVEGELVQLAIAIARQLIRRELKTQPSEVVAAVREGLEFLPSHARHVRLLLHPNDMEMVRSALSLTEEERRWQIREDPTLTRGGCRLETEHSRIDASVETRLNAAIAKVLGTEREDDKCSE